MGTTRSTTPAKPEFDQATIDAIEASVDSYFANARAWRDSAAILLPENIREAVLSRVKVRILSNQTKAVLETAFAEGTTARDSVEDFDSHIAALVDAANMIADNVNPLVWEIVGQQGNAKTPKKFKQRGFKVSVINGEITVIHKQQVIVKPKTD